MMSGMNMMSGVSPATTGGDPFKSLQPTMPFSAFINPAYGQALELFRCAYDRLPGNKLEWERVRHCGIYISTGQVPDLSEEDE